MNRLERLVWVIRGNASRWAVEDYDDPVDAIGLPMVFWLITSVVGYTAVEAAEWSVKGAATVALLGLVFAAAVTGSLEATLGLKYYATEWTADVRSPEVFD